jgi:hypothetical protein
VLAARSDDTARKIESHASRVVEAWRGANGQITMTADRAAERLDGDGAAPAPAPTSPTRGSGSGGPGSGIVVENAAVTSALLEQSVTESTLRLIVDLQNGIVVDGVSLGRTLADFLTAYADTTGNPVLRSAFPR